MMTIFLSLMILWVVSLCCHEYAHARVAYAGGDITVAAKGYLTMNPLRYMHPVLSVVIPLAVLALGGVPLPGGAVYIDRTRLRSRAWESAVSAAGPAANAALFLLATLPFLLGLRADHSEGGGSLWMVLAAFAFLQAFSVIINLLPVPGLDGFGIIAPYLPYDIRRAVYANSNTIMLVCLILLIAPTGIADWISRTAATATLALGVPRRDLADGVDALFFLRQ